MRSELAASPTSGCLGLVGCLSRFPLPKGRAGPSPRHEAWWSEITLMGIDLTAFYTCSEEDARRSDDALACER